MGVEQVGGWSRCGWVEQVWVGGAGVWMGGAGVGGWSRGVSEWVGELPYSRKYSRDKIFAYFAVCLTSAKILSAN